MTEHKYGSEVVQLICNLALMTGKIGRAGSALLPLRGQNNVQGSSDMGALPDTYTAYRPSTTRTSRGSSSRRGASRCRARSRLHVPQMFDAAVEGSLKAMWIFGEDVAQTDPNTAHVVTRWSRSSSSSARTSSRPRRRKYADVILPASAFLEKSGTFTNAERRFQLVAPAIDPPGSAKTDFEIITTISRALGHDMGWETPCDAMDEIARLTPEYAGVSHERIGRRGLQWPVAADGTDSPILYEKEFRCRAGARASRRCPTRRPATRPTTSSRSS